LGSKKNPFWRAYERVKNKLQEQGVNAEFLDAEAYIEKSNSGYVPDLILKFCSNDQFLSGPFSNQLQEQVGLNKIPIVNPLHASYFGYRGFMTELNCELSDLFPDQYLFGRESDESDLEQFLWVKLEAAGFEYVVNYNELRRWAKDALLHLINRDFKSFDNSVAGRSSGDALKLIQAKDYIINSPEDQVIWLGQSNVEPLSTSLKIAGIETKVKILHRVYWFMDNDEKVEVSLEGFGCEESQFRSSKGKINAGTGFSVPMMIK